MCNTVTNVSVKKDTKIKESKNDMWFKIKRSNKKKQFTVYI